MWDFFCNFAPEKERKMHSQSYTVKELAKCASCTEMRDLGYVNRDALEEEIKEQIIPQIATDRYRMEWERAGELCVNKKEDNKQYLFQNLIVRKICKNVGGVYKVKQANRNAIIRQVKSLLKAPCELYVLRLDIHHFYESIDGAKLIERLKIDGKVNAQTIAYIEQIFDEAKVLGITGLPKGVGISAVFSEMAMKPFDYSINRLEGVYYYARFVDDMILFCNSEEAIEKAYVTIKSTLQDIGLSLNVNKTNKWIQNKKAGSCSKEPLEYLGYCFSKSGIDGELQVSIAKNKIKKIKTRIVRSFVSYMRRPDFTVLHKRLHYLTGNMKISVNNSILPQCVGLYYNYRYIDANSPSLKELQVFYQNLLHCKTGRLGMAMVSHMSTDEYAALRRCSFVQGFQKKISHSFTRSEIKQITRIW